VSAVPAPRAPSAPVAQLLGEHRGLVRRIAFHLAARLPPCVDIDDLIQAGLLGLMQAREHYRDGRGAAFETFASIRIRGAMLDELRRGDWAPRPVHQQARRAAATLRDLEQSRGRPVSAGEVAAAMGIPLERYHRITADAARAPLVSLFDEAGASRGDRIAASGDAQPAAVAERDAFLAALTEAIAHLPERERQLMALYYREDLNFREIGVALSVTESRVCQLHGQALLRLRGRLADWCDREPAADLAQAA
jgi:RNA polymerase sigma factor for flagellar operon FliA